MQFIRDILEERNSYLTVRLLSGRHTLMPYTMKRKRAAVSLRNAQVPSSSSSLARSRNIDSGKKRGESKTSSSSRSCSRLSPLIARARARAYVGGIVVIFSIAISRRLPLVSPSHFPSTVFLGAERYLTSRSLSATAYSRDQFTSVANRRGTVRVAEDYDRALPVRRETVPTISLLLILS